MLSRKTRPSAVINKLLIPIPLTIIRNTCKYHQNSTAHKIRSTDDLRSTNEKKTYFEKRSREKEKKKVERKTIQYCIYVGYPAPFSN